MTPTCRFARQDEPVCVHQLGQRLPEAGHPLPDHRIYPTGEPLLAIFRNKIACEEWLIQAYREFGFPITIVRPVLTYGPSQIPIAVGSWQHPYTIVDRMLRGQKVIVPGDGTSLWTVTWNGDFAKGFLGLLGHQQALGHAFHITSDEVLTWNQIYEGLAEALGVKPNLVHIAST